MIGFAIALVVAAPAGVAAPAPPPLRPPGTQRGAAALRALGMSDAGIAVLRRQGAPEPGARTIMAERQATRTKLADAASATPFDVDAFVALLHESSLMETAARSRSEERIVTTLKALPAADRAIFAKAVFGGSMGQHSGLDGGPEGPLQHTP